MMVYTNSSGLMTLSDKGKGDKHNPENVKPISWIAVFESYFPAFLVTELEVSQTYPETNVTTWQKKSTDANVISPNDSNH